jgi:peptidoglycan/xylan/chitin deacetylase (PgdA/CDA1 family)
MLNRREFLKAVVGMAGSWAIMQVAGVSADISSPVLRSGSAAIPFIALTCDDCFDLPIMQRIEQLSAAWPQTQITFFPTGTALLHTAKRDAGLWPRLVAAGHEIGYHTMRHERPSTLSDGQLSADYAEWHSVLTRVLGHDYPVRYGRPPYGEFTTAFADLCARQKLRVAGWSRVWSYTNLDGVQAANSVQAGEIVLLHALRPDLITLMQALPVLAQQRCLTSVTLSALEQMAAFPAGAACRPNRPIPR